MFSALRRLFPLWFLAVCTAWLIPCLAAAESRPVEFIFGLEEDAGTDPFSRDLWAEVRTPSAKTLRLPVYFAGGDKYAVRARADKTGAYELGKVTERIDGKTVELLLDVSEKARRVVATQLSPASVRLDFNDPHKFALTNGRGYTPVGANLAWAPAGRLSFYRKAFTDFQKQGLNWTRVWMCHWGGLNLDWPAKASDKRRSLGALDLRVAAEWDRLLGRAEERGVYVQLVLQHHGQYSTGANPNWEQNPWNIANGGFLTTPGEFFTSPAARDLTKRKYRYIVARWGWSPAILAWELFNEVHWVDALRVEKNEAAVAAWHSEMAAYIRSIDVYAHLITTSTEELHSPIYASMDYFQPHLYSPDMIASPQRYDVAPARLDRPVFYGEVGDDHLRASEKAKKSGVLIVPPVWSSLMGEGLHAAQPWLGADLIATKRLGELGAVARFVAAMNAKTRGTLESFAPVIDCASQQPLVLTPGQHWQRRPAPVISVTTDGRYTPDVAELPHFLVGAPESVADGFPQKMTVRIDMPRESNARITIADAGAKGAALKVFVDGTMVSEESWAPLETTAVADAGVPKRPREIGLVLSAGRHEIVLENTGGRDWVEFGSIDFGLTIPVVAAVGKRSADFAALWLWRHDGVFAEKTPPAVTNATLVLDDMASGKWSVTWWDSLKGQPGARQVIDHAGGTMRLPIPPISRHVALILER